MKTTLKNTNELLKETIKLKQRYHELLNISNELMKECERRKQHEHKHTFNRTTERSKQERSKKQIN